MRVPGEVSVRERLQKLAPAVRATVDAAGPPRSRSMMWKLVRFYVDEGKDYVAGIGAFADHVLLFFPAGRAIESETGLALEGGGKQFRFITLRTPKDAGGAQVKAALRGAFRLAAGSRIARAPRRSAKAGTVKKSSAARGKPGSIDAYLATVSADRRAGLDKLRTTIRSILPEAEECISYSIPAFRYHGHVVAGFAATSKGCSYFPFSGKTLTTLAADVNAYDQTKSALHFDAGRPLPVALVRKLLKARVAESTK
jgi:uncharacterized protein YdhG (YjbR/CyaY superfamily)